MTSFFCRSTATLLALGGAALGVGAMSESALALSQDIINAQLNVPVFTLSNADGSTLSTSLTNSANEGESVSITHVYISPADAEAALAEIQAEAPELAGSYQVTPIPLSEVYKVAVEQDDENVIFDFVPIEEEVDYALSLSPALQEQQPGRVPLFLVSAIQQPEGATVGDISENAAENIGRFTLRNGEREVIPMFFKQDQLTDILEFIAEDQPELADSVFVDVIWLENFISLLANTEDESSGDIQQYRMMPTAESLTFTVNFSSTLSNDAAE